MTFSINDWLIITHNFKWQNTCQTFFTLSRLDFVVNSPSVGWRPYIFATFFSTFEVTIPSLVPCDSCYRFYRFVASIALIFLALLDDKSFPFLWATAFINANFQGRPFFIIKWLLWSFLLFTHPAISKLIFLKILFSGQFMSRMSFYRH